MSNYASLKATINANIKTNGNQEITGNILNSVLNAMVNTLGNGYRYVGMATPTTIPGSHDNRVFYLCDTPGTYNNMGNLVVDENEVAILKYDDVWRKEVTGCATSLQAYVLEYLVDLLDKRIKTIVVEHINLLEGAEKTTGYVYGHGSGTKDSVTSGTIYNDGIPVKAGETLYYKNLYPYFCGIRQADGAWVAMSNTATWNASGEYVVPVDGLLYITINNSAPNHQLLTRDESMYDDDIIVSYSELKQYLLDSVNAEIAEIEDGLDLLEQKTDDLDDRINTIVVEHTNLLEDADKTTGYVYSHESGTINEVSSATIYNDGIPVVAGETLYYKNLYPFFCGIKKTSDNSWVAMSNTATWNASGEYVVPADGLLYITINNAAPNHQLLTRDQSMYDDDIIDSYSEINPDLLPEEDQHVIYIGSTREYTTLRDGIAEAIKYPRSIVYVDPETFDLCQEFASEINAAGEAFYGITLNNDVHVIFAPGAVVNALYQGTNPNVTRYFNPFQTGGEGGFTLENLWIFCKNTRYCIHDEYGGANVRTRNRYINCHMEYDGTTSPYNYFQNCIGGGTAKHSYVEIRNCYFKSVGTMTERGIVSWHNANVADAQSRIIVSNCYFDDGTIRLGYYGPRSLISTAFLNNNSFTQEPFIRAENETAQINNWEIQGFLNEVRS